MRRVFSLSSMAGVRSYTLSMDSTLRLRMACALLALAASVATRAANHDTAVAPTQAGPFAVACSSVELDMARLGAIGGQPTDYWEGAEVAGANRYITEVLAHPESAVVYRASVPSKILMYPLYFGRSVEFAAIVCHPTPRTNTDPDYTIPVQGGVVPHMQPAGAAPKLISAGEFAQTAGLPQPASPGAVAALPLIVFSHGLAGSPLGPGYLDVLKALAAQGYIVGAVFHADNRFSKVHIEDLADFAYALAFFPAVVEMQAMRPLSLKAMTDALLANRGGFAAAIDPDRIGGFGASLGGEAMVHLLGGKITTTLTKACDDPVSDPRVKAAVGYVTYAGQSFLPAFCDGQLGAQYVDRPFLDLSGTADTTAPLTVAKRAVNLMEGSRYFVELAGGKHELAPANVPDVITWTVTFLNAYLGVPWDPAMPRFIRMASVAGGGGDTLTVDVHVPGSAGPGEVRALEFYDGAHDRYVLAAGDSDIASKAARADLVALSLGFKAFAAPAAGAVTACRYANVASGEVAIGVGAFECDLYSRGRGWRAVDSPFSLGALGAGGLCPAGYFEVDRAWSPATGGRFGGIPRARLTTSTSEMRGLLDRGWKAGGAVGCAPP
jgi:predicted dienelactone hydrolase